MKKLIIGALLAGSMLNFIMANNVAEASDNPSCVMLRFTDDTRFDKVESAATLSDMVMEKLLNSGKLNFKETKVIDSNIDELLYNDQKAEFENAKKVAWGANGNILFEGPGFAENRATTVDTAMLGQIVSPDVIKQIGEQNGAEYLIQGTILNIGMGNWMNMDVQQAVAVGSGLLQSALGNAIPGLGMLGGVNIEESGINIQADVRIIKTATGEVIWQKRLMGKKMQKKVGIGFVNVGSTKLSNEIYYKAMEDASTKFADAIIADAEAGKLFVK